MILSILVKTYSARGIVISSEVGSVLCEPVAKLVDTKSKSKRLDDINHDECREYKIYNKT